MNQVTIEHTVIVHGAKDERYPVFVAAQVDEEPSHTDEEAPTIRH